MICPSLRRNSCATIGPTGRKPRSRIATHRARLPDHGDSNFHFDPDQPVENCPAIWAGSANPFVVVMAPWGNSDESLAAAIGTCTVLAEHVSPVGRHLVLAGSDGRHRVLLTHAVCGSPDSYTIPADDALALRLAAVSAFHGVRGGGDATAAGKALQPSVYRRHRLNRLLAILECIDRCSGRPTLRQIAREALSYGDADMRALEWKTSPQRRHAQRLVAEARWMAETGYRRLLMPHNRCLPHGLTAGPPAEAGRAGPDP